MKREKKLPEDDLSDLTIDDLLSELDVDAEFENVEKEDDLILGDENELSGDEEEYEVELDDDFDDDELTEEDLIIDADDDEVESPEDYDVLDEDDEGKKDL